MPTLASLIAPQVVVKTTCGAIRDDRVGIMTTLLSMNMVLRLHTNIVSWDVMTDNANPAIEGKPADSRPVFINVT